MITIDELYDIANETIHESLKFQGVVNAIDMGMDEDDLEHLFPWIGTLDRRHEDIDGTGRRRYTKPDLTVRDRRDDTESYDSPDDKGSSADYVEEVDNDSDDDASLTDDDFTVYTEDDGSDDVQICTPCSLLSGASR